MNAPMEPTRTARRWFCTPQRYNLRAGATGVNWSSRMIRPPSASMVPAGHSIRPALQHAFQEDLHA